MKQQTLVPSVTRPWRGESAEERLQQRRARFMEAALEAFAKHGIAKTTMRDICSEARLTERYFYESFRSTEHAFDSVYSKLKEELVRRVTDALVQAPRDIPSLARAGLHAFFTFIQEDSRRARIMLIDAVSANRSSLERSRAALMEYVGLIDGLAQSLFPNLRGRVDIEMIAWGVLGVAIQVGAVWAGRGMRQPIDEILDYNLYAWRGLEAWFTELSTSREDPDARDGSTPRRGTAVKARRRPDPAAATANRRLQDKMR